MAKNEANVAAVLTATDEILDSNGGKIPFEDWKLALKDKVGEHTNALKHIMSHKLVILWLEGFNADGSPQLWVVSDPSMRVEAQPIGGAK